MKRRDFITGAAVSAVSFTYILSTAHTLKNGNSKSMASDAVTDFELNELTVEDLQQRMKSGRYSSEMLTQLYLKRIEEIDKKGPSLNSVIEVNPDAVQIARKMDEERRKGKIRGPLHGIPILLKDNIDTADKMMTTAGALALLGNKATEDAFLVKRLRAAGAVILGKTNLSEWANFRSSRSVSGWSSRGGQTKNPYILDRSPCGSSSGSAVAVAANLCALAVGTETDGSIACPASMNGIIGIKPTVGLVSRSGIIPISHTQDTAGPFARTVRDAALLLNVLTGVDVNDHVTLESEGKAQPDYTRFLDMNGLHGKRIGVEKTFLKRHEAIDPLVKKALDQMRSKGAEILEVEFINKQKELGADEFKVLLYEFKEGVNNYLSKGHAPVKTLQDVISFNLQNEKKAMPYFKQEILDSAQAKGGLDSKEYQEALAKTHSMRKTLDSLLEEHRLDAVCGPATGTAWCIDFINGDFWTGYGSYGPAAVAGYPSITVPMGAVHELPIGITFMGKAYDEHKLLAIAFAYEQASKNRKPPTFKKTLV
ncbi:MAG: amidase [Flavisolibacter sp.]|nr:amidase [Flavisolibacter sp.]